MDASDSEGSSVSVRSGREPPVHLRKPLDTALPRAGPPPIGRERELAATWTALAKGLPVQIYGTAGSGRSTLLHHLAQAKAAAGAPVIFLSALGFTVDDLLQVLFDACYENDGYRPKPVRLRQLMSSV